MVAKSFFDKFLDSKIKTEEADENGKQWYKAQKEFCTRNQTE